MDCSLSGSHVHGISQARSAFTLLNNQSPELFPSCRTSTLYLLNNNCPFSPPSSPGQPPFCSVSINLTTLVTSQNKRNHTVFVLLWLVYFTQHNVFRIHSYHSIWQPAFLLKTEKTSHYMYIPHFASPSSRGLFGLLPLFSYCKWCCYEHGCANISSRSCFQFFCLYKPGVESLVHTVILL